MHPHDPQTRADGARRAGSARPAAGRAGSRRAETTGSAA